LAAFFFASHLAASRSIIECDQWQQKTVPKYRLLIVLTALLIEVPEFTGFNKKRNAAMWTKPTFTDLRIGFEVTMYIANR